MAIPNDWSMKLHLASNQLIGSVSDVRAICPHCRNASTFSVQAQYLNRTAAKTDIHLILKCNYSACQETVHVWTTGQAGSQAQHSHESFFMYPSKAIEPPHPALPSHIADDWTEGQRAIQASAPKAAAVMFRRVFYGVLIDKGIKLNPLREALKELISAQRLLAIFDEWLPAIRDDGHDGAHPERALQVSDENIAETMEYTSELLRFLYIEPYDFQRRKERNQSQIT